MIGEPTPNPDGPMFRGTITINADFTNFGQPQRVIFYPRYDTSKASAPLRIFHASTWAGLTLTSASAERITAGQVFGIDPPPSMLEHLH